MINYIVMKYLEEMRIYSKNMMGEDLRKLDAILTHRKINRAVELEDSERYLSRIL